MTWRGRTAIAVAGVLACGALWFGVRRAMHHVAFFAVHRIEVIGNRYLREEEVVAALHLNAARSIADPLDSVLAAAERIPGVAAVSVERRFPGTLRVTILEEVPVALSMRHGQLQLIDHRGRALPFDPSRQETSFPIADTTTVVAELLARILMTSSEWYAEIDGAALDDGDVVIRIGAHRVRLRPDADEETLRGVLAVRAYLSRTAIAWVEIDARYHGRVFVEKQTA